MVEKMNTITLDSDKESLAALLESHAIRDKGGRPEGIGPEEAFKDVLKDIDITSFRGHYE
jgi:hypothetical protein